MKTIPFTRNLFLCMVLITITLSANSKTDSPRIKEENVTYMANGVTLKGFIAYDENIKGKRPVVLLSMNGE
jgi:hypothetical protein